MNRTDCPSDERLAAYLDGTLPSKSKNELEHHLADCLFCSEVLTAANETHKPDAIETPPNHLIEKVKALFPEEKAENKQRRRQKL